MTSSDGFTFKRFHVQHAHCAMKVGTDGVLLGCWTTVPAHGRVLDIGTGSGLIALMMAQRNETHIDAIDICANAIEQATYNFQQSPWAERLHAHLSSLQAWQNEEGYDLIVSNPPYFQNSLKNPDKKREQARHTDTLSFAELMRHSARLLNEKGIFSIILPAETEQDICSLAQACGLNLVRIARVYSKESKPLRRVMLTWSKKPQTLLTEETIVLEDATGGRSQQYQQLTKDFYL